MPVDDIRPQGDQAGGELRLSDSLRRALLQELRLSPGEERGALIGPISAIPGCTQLLCVLTLPPDAGPPAAGALLRALLASPVGAAALARAGGGGGAGCKVRFAAQVGDNMAAATARAGAPNAASKLSPSGAAGQQPGWQWVLDEPQQLGHAAGAASCWAEPAALLLVDDAGGNKAPAAAAQQCEGWGAPQQLAESSAWGPQADPARPQLRFALHGVPAAWLGPALGGIEGHRAPPPAAPRVVVVQGDRVLLDSRQAPAGVEAFEDGGVWAIRWARWHAVRLKHAPALCHAKPGGAARPKVQPCASPA